MAKRDLGCDQPLPLYFFANKTSFLMEVFRMDNENNFWYYQGLSGGVKAVRTKAPVFYCQKYPEGKFWKKIRFRNMLLNDERRFYYDETSD